MHRIQSGLTLTLFVSCLVLELSCTALYRNTGQQSILKNGYQRIDAKTRQQAYQQLMSLIGRQISYSNRTGRIITETSDSLAETSTSDEVFVEVSSVIIRGIIEHRLAGRFLLDYPETELIRCQIASRIQEYLKQDSKSVPLSQIYDGTFLLFVKSRGFIRDLLDSDFISNRYIVIAGEDIIGLYNYDNIIPGTIVPLIKLFCKATASIQESKGNIYIQSSQSLPAQNMLLKFLIQNKRNRIEAFYSLAEFLYHNPDLVHNKWLKKQFQENKKIAESLPPAQLEQFWNTNRIERLSRTLQLTSPGRNRLKQLVSVRLTLAHEQSTRLDLCSDERKTLQLQCSPAIDTEIKFLASVLPVHAAHVRLMPKYAENSTVLEIQLSNINHVGDYRVKILPDLTAMFGRGAGLFQPLFPDFSFNCTSALNVGLENGDNVFNFMIVPDREDYRFYLSQARNKNWHYYLFLIVLEGEHRCSLQYLPTSNSSGNEFNRQDWLNGYYVDQSNFGGREKYYFLFLSTNIAFRFQKFTNLKSFGEMIRSAQFNYQIVQLDPESS